MSEESNSYLALLEASLPDRSHPCYAAWRQYALDGPARSGDLATLIESIVIGPAQRVLDLGCGDGGLTVALAERGLTVSAIDRDRSAATRVMARLRLAGAHADVGVGDAATLPFPSGMFQIVVAQDVVEHLDDPVAALTEACRVLAEDGILLVSAPNRLAWHNLLSDPHWGLAGVSWMPRRIAEVYVCKVRRRAVTYDVGELPSPRGLWRWLVRAGFPPTSVLQSPAPLLGSFRRTVLRAAAFKSGQPAQVVPALNAWLNL